MAQKQWILRCAFPMKLGTFSKRGARGINLIGTTGWVVHTRDIKEKIEESFQEWGRLINMIGLGSNNLFVLSDTETFNSEMRLLWKMI